MSVKIFHAFPFHRTFFKGKAALHEIQNSKIYNSVRAFFKKVRAFVRFFRKRAKKEENVKKGQKGQII